VSPTRRRRGPGRSGPFMDGDPQAPVPAAVGVRRVLGHDPLAEPEEPDPFLARVEGPVRAPAPAAVPPTPAGPLEERPPVRPAPPPAAPRMPRLEEFGPAPEAPLAAGAIDPRLWDALAHLVDEGDRYDRFGLSPETVRRTLPFVHALYRFYFRVRSRGHEHLPAEGPALLVANHGGLLPFDGAMGVLDVLLHTDPPRLPRALVDRFAGGLPFVNVAFARLGQVVATRENFRELLRREQLVWVFPEGVEGIRKPVSQRYRLQCFRPGFVEEALRARAPIVPVAIVGADDQAPILYDVRPLARWLGLPTAPITPTFPWLGPLGLVPYPVPYRIVYGEPLRLHERYGPEAADDPGLVRYLAGQVRRTVQRMVDRSRGA